MKKELRLLKQYGYMFVRQTKHGKLFKKDSAGVLLPSTPRVPRPIKYLIDDILQNEREVAAC